jgi:hypothetical protein
MNLSLRIYRSFSTTGRHITHAYLNESTAMLEAVYELVINTIPRETAPRLVISPTQSHHMLSLCIRDKWNTIQRTHEFKPAS